MNPLQAFMAELLEQAGALVEPIEPEGLEILAPPPLQQALQLPELVRLGFGAALPSEARRVSLESDWMERLAALLDDKGRWTRQVLEVDNPAPGNPERVLQHTLELVNATYRLQEVSPAWTRYWLLQFRYTAISDERRDGLLALGFNLASGATLDGLQEALLDALANPDLAGAQPELPPTGLPESWSRPQLVDILQRTLPTRVAQRLQPFLNNMQRRQARDLERLFDYHNDLREQTLARLAALAEQGPENEKQQAERAREAQRLAAIGREYQAKIDDLRQKYAMQIEIEWIQTLELTMPVQRFSILIKRRKGERIMPLDWNPLARRLEQAPCERSYTWKRARQVLDDTLQLVSPDAEQE